MKESLQSANPLSYGPHPPIFYQQSHLCFCGTQMLTVSINNTSALALRWACLFPFTYLSTCSLIFLCCWAGSVIMHLSHMYGSSPHQLTGKQTTSFKKQWHYQTLPSPLPPLPKDLSFWLLFSWTLLGSEMLFQAYREYPASSCCSLSKEDELRTALIATAFQEKVGAKVIKIAVEKLFLPTLLHPSSSSFFTFIFAAFCTWAKAKQLYLMPSFFRRSSFFFWKNQVSALVAHGARKNWLLQPPT